VEDKPIIGIEAFEPSYGAAYRVDAELPHTQACEIVEDGGLLECRTPAATMSNLERVAFVDGVRRADARLTATTQGRTCAGLAGAHGVGAVLAAPDTPIRIDRLSVTRLVLWGDGQHHPLPPVHGWVWQTASVSRSAPDAPLQELQSRMRFAEGALAKALCHDGWLTLVDGPLNYIRSRDIPVIGYVKTHHRPLLEPEQWRRVPHLKVGQRTSLFALRTDVYACFTRVGDAGRWASPWAGIVRLEVPASVGLQAAAETADRAAVSLPRFASMQHRDPRAPVNLQPIGALERRLHRELGSHQLAARAVRDSVRCLMSGAH
jgi:hypothetical protein